MKTKPRLRYWWRSGKWYLRINPDRPFIPDDWADYYPEVCLLGFIITLGNL